MMNELEFSFPVEYYGSKNIDMLCDVFLGRGNVYSLIRTLHNQSLDFPGIYADYIATIDNLRKSLGAGAKRSIDKLMVAIDMKCTSILFCAGIEGIKMNFRHFSNPTDPNYTWPQVDFYDNLYTGIPRKIPQYICADDYLENFYAPLLEEHKEAISTIRNYASAIEADGMKLAHFYGYLAGNELLAHLIPDYSPDRALDIAYAHLLSQHFGLPIRMDVWNGYYRCKNWISAPITLSHPQEDFIYRNEIMQSCDP